jgi:ADP-heptose:LPS heptosyltransferase
MKNWLLLLFVKLFARKNPQDLRFLVVSTTALGDTLWATPAIQNLRKTFPNAFIGVLTGPPGLEIFRNVDRIYLWKHPWKLWKQLRKDRYHTVLLFHASQRLVLPFCATLGAQKIIGTAGINKGLDSLLTDPLNNYNEHEIVRRLQIVEKAGGKIFTEELVFDLPPTQKSGKQKVALHPGSKDSFKRWPVERFIEVGLGLKNCEIFVTGTEKELVHQIQKAIPEAKHVSTKSLKDLAAFLSGIDLLISNDTGPVHLACALKVPVIAIYSPTDPSLCGPHKAKHALAIYKKPTCTPCLKRKCPEPFCLYRISSEEILEAASNFIQ